MQSGISMSIRRVNMEPKKPWYSKTLWVSLICAVAPFIPTVGTVIAANPEAVGVVVGVVFTFLRITTEKGLEV